MEDKLTTFIFWAVALTFLGLLMQTAEQQRKTEDLQICPEFELRVGD